MSLTNLFRNLTVVAVLALMVSCQGNAEADTATETTTETEAVGKTVSNTDTEAAPLGIKVGDKAPAFNLKGVDGKMYSFENVKDADGNTPKGYVVTFTCNTCPYAVAYEDRLIELHNTTAALGYPLIAIQPNDPELKEGDNFENMQQRATDKGFPFVYLMDEGQKIYPAYGARYTPEVYLVDSDLILRYHGAIDDNAQDADEVTVNYVEKAIEAINNGMNPDPADVKAIGCTIKTKKI